jgi:glycosyltransferase involved in cell wall biosynthesis
LVAIWHSPTLAEHHLNLFEYGGVRGRVAFLLLAPTFAIVELLALMAATDVVVLSRYTGGLLLRLYPVRALTQKTVVVAGAADARRFRPSADPHTLKKRLGYRADVPLLLAVRRLVHRTGVARLVSVGEAIRGAGIRAKIVIAGRGPLRSSIEREISSRGLSSHVQLVGFIADSELPNWYAAADATLVPSERLECFGLPAIESLLSGTPCLATPCGALPEVLREYPEFVSESNSTESFARLVVEFLRSEKRYDREQLSRQAALRYSFDALGRSLSVITGDTCL